MKKYQFVPAAAAWYPAGGLAIYVKYTKNPNRVELVKGTKRYCWLKCPDRDLFITNSDHVDGYPYPADGTYDECNTFNFFHEESLQEAGCNFFMVNYVAEMGKEKFSHNNIINDQNKVKIISDSGGFQISGAMYEYIDPVKLTEWYNKNCNLGMVLDIPGYLHDEKTVRRAAAVQNQNTLEMIKHKRSDLEIINIIHGSTQKERDIFREVCERSDIDRVALGGHMNKTIMESVDSLLEAITMNKKYKHYHVLGISNNLQLILYNYLATRGVTKLITSDSSAHLKNAVNRRYLEYRNLERSTYFVNLDTVSYVPSVYNNLACSCGVCKSLKYTDVLMCIPQIMFTYLVAHHNMVIRLRYIEAMYEFMQHSTLKEIKDLVKLQYGSTRNVNYPETIESLDFIDYALNHNLEKARKKFSYYLGVTNKAHSTGLFSEVVTKEKQERIKHMDKVLHLYETGEGKKLHGRSSESRKRNSKRIKSSTKRVLPK